MKKEKKSVIEIKKQAPAPKKEGKTLGTGSGDGDMRPPKKPGT